MSDEKEINDKKEEKLLVVVNILTLISENENILDVCEINFESIKCLKLKSQLILQEHKSASHSRMLFGELVSSCLNNNGIIPIAVKMFVGNTKSTFTSSLTYEVLVYKFITKHIIQKNFSPNFVSYLGVGCCSINKLQNYFENSESVISSLLEENEYYEQIRLGTSSKKKNLYQICLLITERVGSGSYFGFNSMCKVSSLNSIKKEISPQELYKILFQIIHALSILQFFELSHNDLHDFNILVLELPNPVKMGYNIIENKTITKKYTIETKYIPYIYDWDLSQTKYIKTQNEHLKKGKYNVYGISFDYNPSYDLYKILCYLLEYISKFDNPISKNENITKIMHLQEDITENKQLRLPIDEHTKQMIQIFIPEVIDNNVSIYKFTKKQFTKILGTQYDFLKFKTIMFSIVEDNLGNNYVNIHHPHECSQTIVDENFPTPQDLFLTAFDMFSVDINTDFSIPKRYVYNYYVKLN